MVKAAELLDSIAGTIETAVGWHGWLWRERCSVVRSEIELALGEYTSALRRAEASIEVCRRHRRMKYLAAAQIVRADARIALGDRDGGLADLAAFLFELAPDRDPHVRLRVSAALLQHVADERARDIANTAATTIERGLARGEQPAFRARVDALHQRPT